MSALDSKKITALLMAVLSIMFLFQLIPIRANPIISDIATTSYFIEGTTIHNGTNIQMPEANVEIFYNHSECDELSMECIFQTYTNKTQNATLAFVQPSVKNDWYEYQELNYNMVISVNSIITNYSVYTWEELGWNASNYPELDTYGSWLSGMEYAIFNANLIANATTSINVSINATGFRLGNYFELKYIVGSARTFDSDTHQRIQMKIMESTPVIDMQYYPEDYLSIEIEGNETYLTWDFMLSKFQHNYVYARYYVYTKSYTYPTNASTTTSTVTNYFSFDPELIGVVGGIAGITMVIFAVFLAMHKNRS